MFEKGQRVVCVDDSPCWRDLPSNLVKGAIYTITECWESFTCKGSFAVNLSEMQAQPTELYSGWRAERFRPIDERKTDISVFTKMLNKQTEDA